MRAGIAGHQDHQTQTKKASENMNNPQAAERRAESELISELGFSFKAQNGGLTVIQLEPKLKITTLTQTDGKWDACYELDKAWSLLIKQKIALAQLTLEFADDWQRPDVLEA